MKIKQKDLQAGFAHAGLILIVIVVIGAVGAAAYRVGANSRAEKEAAERLRSSELAADEARKLAETNLEETAAEEIKIPEPASEIAETPKVTTTKKKTVATEQKKEYSHFDYTSLTHTFENGVLTVTGMLPEAFTGSCKLYLKMGEQVHKVYQQLNGATSCTASVSASDLPAPGEWTWELWVYNETSNVNAKAYTTTF